MEEKASCITINCACCGNGSGGGGNIPEIGENGNWFINGEDTGISSRGDSAYQLAVKNGFIGTEVEWLESLKGSANSILNYDVLFEGRANVLDTEYSLAHSVTDYKFLIVECTLQADNGLSYLYYNWIVSPKASVVEGYGNLLHVDNGGSVVKDVYLYFYFPSATKVMPHRVVCSSLDGRLKSIAITKICGIK